MIKLCRPISWIVVLLSTVFLAGMDNPNEPSNNKDKNAQQRKTKEFYINVAKQEACRLRRQRAMHHAAWEQNIEACQELFTEGEEINALDQAGHTPLYMAIGQQKESALYEWFLEHGVTLHEMPNPPVMVFTTAIHWLLNMRLFPSDPLSPLRNVPDDLQTWHFNNFSSQEQRKGKLSDLDIFKIAAVCGEVGMLQHMLYQRPMIMKGFYILSTQRFLADALLGASAAGHADVVGLLWDCMVNLENDETIKDDPEAVSQLRTCRLQAGERALSIAVGQRHTAVFKHLFRHDAPRARALSVLQELISYCHSTEDQRKIYHEMYKILLNTTDVVELSHELSERSEPSLSSSDSDSSTEPLPTEIFEMIDDADEDIPEVQLVQVPFTFPRLNSRCTQATIVALCALIISTAYHFSW